jgi:lipopolysaccharide transport system ATP-binding protein
MSDYAIQVEDVSKLYHIGARKTYKTARESVMNLLQAPVRMANKLAGREKVDHTTDLWALKNVSFDVKRGEVIGIIGRNGAGKSTLLKVLSRITEPTSGRIKINGRVGSLLEVGTGFHPELTGRENIFLNGAILGMRRWEIASKFDEIVGFSEIEKFIDTPVKHYSSGMYMRLAFAVAAHLEPEILVVDEVLAVGDAAFQKKCLGKMKDVAGQGRTVLFVSHNMRAIEQLCSSVIHMSRGQVKNATDDVRGELHRYFLNDAASSGDHYSTDWVPASHPTGNDLLRLRRFFLGGPDQQPLPQIVRNDQDMWIYLDFDIERYDPALNIGYALLREDGQNMYWAYHRDSNDDLWPPISAGHNRLRTRLPKRLFSEGRYRVELAIGLHGRDWVFEPGRHSPSIDFEILGGLTDSTQWMPGRFGVLTPVTDWEIPPQRT